MKLLPTCSAFISSLALAFSMQVIAGFPVDINSAPASELAQGLDGVGPAKAEAIVAYRDQFGPFMTADELVAVRGIGAATLERNRDNILLTSDPELNVE
ncbi:MAG TPA: helix-hairpin-helix domain-containing protein [Marinobacterium sp.]|nr:helix-hairpin-helix domain-containing protein [Marinobacterium sp.]